MLLDRTAIGIRERGMLEILDLSLQVTRAYFGTLLPLLLVGAIPLALLNHFALRAVLGEMDPQAYTPDEVLAQRVRFWWDSLVLAFLQAPLATAALTTFLGRAAFCDQLTRRQVLRDVRSVANRLLLCQGLLRLAGVAVFVAALMCGASYESLPGWESILSIMAVIMVLVRSRRPYLNEIILLEKNPIRPQESLVSIGERNQSLHAAGTGTLAFLSLGGGMMAVLLVLALFHTVQFFQGVLFNRWDLGGGLLAVGVPLAIWLTMGLMTVFRFLCYLDLRIRQEGWAVELRLRAEANKVQQDLTIGLGK